MLTRSYGVADVHVFERTSEDEPGNLLYTTQLGIGDTVIVPPGESRRRKIDNCLVAWKGV